MTNPPADPNAAAVPPQGAPEPTLRQRAEAEFNANKTPNQAGRLLEVTQQVLHELQVHQIELELQNDELRRTQVKLEMTRARYFDLYNLAPVGYVTLNEKGLIVEANLTAAGLLGVAGRSKLVGQLLTTFIHFEDQDIYYRHRKHLAHTGKAQACELRLARPDNSQFWARLEMLAIDEQTPGAGAASACWVTLNDITTLKWAEETLHQSNTALEQRVEERSAELRAANAELRETNEQLVSALRVKDEFLSIMSHELRTPLTGILGLAETLQLPTPNPLTEKQATSVRLIYQSGERLLALINDVLDLVALTAKSAQLEHVSVDIAAVCQASLQATKAQADKKQIAALLALDPAVTALQADPRRLKQILVCLLDNAVKFTPAGGQVGLTVSGDEKRRRVEFSVWDTGIGIAAEDLPRLFQDFVQLDMRLTRNYQGAGLGLALVKRLTELHGGQVTVESQGAPGKGSRFTVSLPWEAPDSAARG